MMLMAVRVFVAMFIVMGVLMRVSMPMFVVVMLVVVIMPVFMFSMIVVMMVMVVLMRQVHVKLHAFDASLLFARHVQVIAIEFKLFQLAFQLARIHPQVNQRANEHIAADATENVEVKGFHLKWD